MDTYGEPPASVSLPGIPPRVLCYSKVVMAKRKSDKWFKKVRGSYLPCSWQGWLTYIPFIGYMVLSYYVVYQHNENSVVDIIIGVFPQWIAATVIMTWLAQRKS